MDIPDVHYARAGGVAVAYQIVGEGHQTLLLSPQVSDLFTIWLSRDTSSFLRRLAAKVRVIILNPRGTGLSDRPRNITLDARMDDLTAVLDHARIDRATFMGISTSANACALFAASHPDRVERLVLVDPFPRGIPSGDYPWGFDEDGWLSWIREIREHWGERAFMERFGHQMASSEITNDPAELDLFVWRGRLSLSPTAAADWSRIAMETDIVDVLPSIRVPTLVLHRSDEGTAGGVGPARFVAERIRGARTIGVDVFSDQGADAVLEFVSGVAHVAVPDSVLATVLFTDLVGSTERRGRARRPRAGATSSLAITPTYGASSPSTAVSRSIPPGTGSSADLRRPSAGDLHVLVQSSMARKRTTWTCVQAIHTGECELAGRQGRWYRSRHGRA